MRHTPGEVRAFLFEFSFKRGLLCLYTEVSMSVSPKPRRQVIKYTFFKVDLAWRRLPLSDRQQGMQEFASVINEFASRLSVRTYSLMGMRGDTDFLIWAIAPTLECIREMSTKLASTGLGRYLSTPYSYLALSRPSPYVSEHQHQGQEGVSGMVEPDDMKYLFVYPFVKTHARYQMPQEERQRMMNEHFRIGHKYPMVKIKTSYSFGLDDQEFVLGFETDDPASFLDLVTDLRESEARPYTERDTPIFTCVTKPLQGCLDDLG